MRVLMISLDRGLFGSGSSGDVLERHKKYADLTGDLDVIVFAGAEYERKDWGKNLRVFPTRSKKFNHYRNALEIAKKLVSDNKYDLLITQDFAAPVGEKLKREFDIPWIVSVHGMFFSSSWLGLNPLNWYLLKKIKSAIRTADGFRVNNEIIKDKLLKWGITGPILIQPTAIDVKKFKNIRSNDSRSKINVLFVGRLSAEKNIPMLIKAFQSVKSKIQNLELTIVGDGSERKKLVTLADGDQSIKFLGAKTINELPEIFAMADIFVLPSNTETFGQVLLQAAASGCAIIATKTTGAQMLLENGKNAILIPVGDEKMLLKNIEILTRDAEQRDRLSENAQILADQFDQGKMIEKLVDFWKKIAIGN